MSHNVRKHSEFLKVLARCSAKQRKALLQNAGPALLKSLCECTLNVLKGNVRLTSHQKRQLVRHKRNLRLLADRKVSLKRKKQPIMSRVVVQYTRIRKSICDWLVYLFFATLCGWSIRRHTRHGTTGPARLDTRGKRKFLSHKLNRK